jgi:tripartite-type tricarboxylate transporter receptor subunit TctC
MGCIMKNYLRRMGGAVLLAASLAAGAQERVTLVAPFPPGGPVDVLSRILAEGLQKKTGQTVLVENLPGAAGNLGIDKVKRAKPDGKTWLVVPAGNLTINPTLMPNFPFNIERDFVPVTMLAKAPNVLVASTAAKLGSLPHRASAAVCIWPVNCSSCKPKPICCMCPTKGLGLRSTMCWAAPCP